MLSVLVKIEVIGIHYQIDIVGWMWLVWHIRSVKHSVSFTQMLVNGLQLFICQQMLSVLVKIEVIGIHY